MANTGLRPDEARNLQHRDVEVVTDDWSGEKILEIEVRGKRGVGYCMSTPGAVRPYGRLSDRPKPVEAEEDTQTRARKRRRRFSRSPPIPCSPATTSRCSTTSSPKKN
jgi:hypothetical protein